MKSPQADFNRIARTYRWLEYLTLWRCLERCRFYFLPRLRGCNQALVLGDGDGRFVARLLKQNPTLRADAVDTSGTMLQLLAERCEKTSPSTSNRLTVHHTDALTYVTPGTLCTLQQVDLVVTHFFLDCLTQPEVERLTVALAPRLAAGAIWLVSDFRVPDDAMRLPAKVFIRLLYLAFRIITGLRATHLPDHRAAFLATGFSLREQHFSLAGLLMTELWVKGQTSSQ